MTHQLVNHPSTLMKAKSQKHCPQGHGAHNYLPSVFGTNKWPALFRVHTASAYTLE